MHEVLKALHVTAMVAWMAGMVATPPLVARASRSRRGPDAGGAGDGALLAALRAHNSRVTAPAMLLALALGLWLAQDAGWFRAGWLQAKLVLVLALAALHGVLAGQLRRLVADPAYAAPGWVGRLHLAVLALVLGIAVLAISKPHHG
jgi:putative membrane protein